MMVQDQYSGYVHEVPDQYGGYGLGEPVYDGLGNPVGFIGPLRNIVSNIPIVGGLVNRLLPGTSPPPYAPPAYTPPAYTPPPAVSPSALLQRALLPGIRRPWPLGWNRPQLPYTGLGPRRLYMRCAVWPGPRGLVPAHAASMPPGAWPGQPGAPGMPVPYGGGRRRRRGRRR
jgi:hypothetical protein